MHTVCSIQSNSNIIQLERLCCINSGMGSIGIYYFENEGTNDVNGTQIVTKGVHRQSPQGKVSVFI